MKTINDKYFGLLRLILNIISIIYQLLNIQFKINRLNKIYVLDFFICAYYSHHIF